MQTKQATDFFKSLQKLRTGLSPYNRFKPPVTFNNMFVHIIFSLVWVAELPPFGTELPTRLTICSL